MTKNLVDPPKILSMTVDMPRHVENRHDPVMRVLEIIQMDHPLDRADALNLERLRAEGLEDCSPAHARMIKSSSGHSDLADAINPTSA